jgi:glycosyltransferase involved in cell wall biosynthesis
MGTLGGKVYRYALRILRGDVSVFDAANKAFLKISYKYRVLLSSLELYLVKRKKAVKIVSSRTQRVISPYDGVDIESQRYYLTNVVSGSYQVELNCFSLEGSVREARIYIELSNDVIDSKLATRMGVEKDNYGRYFLTVKENRLSAHELAYHALIKIPMNQRWVKLRFYLGETANDFKLTDIRFKPTDSSVYESVAMSAVTTYLTEAKQDLSDVRYILYADINLNVVDGSSVWLTSMASMLCGYGKTLVLCKEDTASNLTLSNINDSAGNLVLIQPSDIEIFDSSIKVEQAVELVKALDFQLPKVRYIVSRGLESNFLLTQTRQFYRRLAVYLTDFYTLDTNGRIKFAASDVRRLKQCLVHADVVLVQTPEIEKKLIELSGVDFRSVELPPIIPEFIPLEPSKRDEKTIRIGYAGKINPDWGVVELLEFVRKLNASDSYKVELHIVANKITEKGIRGFESGFHGRLVSKIKKVGAIHYKNFNRSESMKKMNEMDFVWCWRPSILEENTLEVSTKLIETIALNRKAICYPNEINIGLLGENYPYFAKRVEDVFALLDDANPLSLSYSEKVRRKHSYKNRLDSLAPVFAQQPQPIEKTRIVVAGHDFKFIDAFMSDLKTRQFQIIRDVWAWGEGLDIERSKEHMKWADIVLCEWGLGNAVWYSNNIPDDKPLFIRVHLQEVNERARKFGYDIKIANVTKMIFVSERVRQEAITLFGWPVDKTVVIPNYTLDDEYKLRKPQSENRAISIGMVGIIPMRKRFDLAVELLSDLNGQGFNATLYIKGPRPEEIEFMHAPSRKAELEYYNDIYRLIESSPNIRDKVVFEPWGNDVAVWYQKIDYILSCSDFESFHYALADGVLSGCLPLLWPWDEAESIYSPEWIVNDVKQASKRIIENETKTIDEQVAAQKRNRDLVVARYGRDVIFQEISSQICIQT